MASLDAALSRLAIALDAVEARLPGALNSGRQPLPDESEEIEALKAERAQLRDEVDRLRSEIRALDDLHEEMSNRLDNAIREVRLVIAE